MIPLGQMRETLCVLNMREMREKPDFPGYFCCCLCNNKFNLLLLYLCFGILTHHFYLLVNVQVI